MFPLSVWVSFTQNNTAWLLNPWLMLVTTSQSHICRQKGGPWVASVPGGVVASASTAVATQFHNKCNSDAHAGSLLLHSLCAYANAMQMTSQENPQSTRQNSESG